MAVVTLLSDFVDGSSMALAEDTDAHTLNDYMTRKTRMCETLVMLKMYSTTNNARHRARLR